MILPLIIGNSLMIGKIIKIDFRKRKWIKIKQFLINVRIRNIFRNLGHMSLKQFSKT